MAAATGAGIGKLRPQTREAGRYFFSSKIYLTHELFGFSCEKRGATNLITNAG